MSATTSEELLHALQATPAFSSSSQATVRPPSTQVLKDILTTIRTEIQLSTPNIDTLLALLNDMWATHADIIRQAARDIEQKGSTEAFGDDAQEMTQLTIDIQNVGDEIRALSASRVLAIEQAAIPPAPAEPVDIGAAHDDDTDMSTPSREEIDARLETIETRMDGRLSSIEQMIAIKFAEFDATLHKTNADTIKWVAGTVIAVGAAGLALMTFLINNMAPKPPAAGLPPIVITVPIAAPIPSPQAQPAK